jgi:hypothetical protein
MFWKDGASPGQKGKTKEQIQSENVEYRRIQGLKFE